MEFVHFDWFSQLYSEWRQTSKLVNLKISAKVRVCNSGQNMKWLKLLRSVYAIQVNIWKWLKLLKSFKFIKKTLLNHLYIWIWSFWLIFTALQLMKRNFKISQFSRFLLMSEYAIQVKILKCIKLPNSVPFIKKTLLYQAYIRIWSFWLTFTVLQWMKKNSKIIQFSSFLLTSKDWI